MDLNLLSLAELKKLHKDVTAAIASFEDRAKAKARAELEAQARAMGFSLAELIGGAVPRKYSPAVAKYRNPENPTEIWSGLGRRPVWFIAALAAGKKPDDLAI
jgi:DNA-binding protein H-NS